MSSARADLLPSPRRIRSPELATDLEVSSADGSEPSRYRGTDLEMDDDVKRIYGIDIDPEIQAEIDECITYADALRQPVFKRQNVRGQNVARAYTAGNNEKKGYVGSLPYCNKCKLHHAGPCNVRCGNCKRAGHMTKDYKVAVTPNTQRAPVRNHPGIVCYECGRPGHFKKDYPKLRNQNRGYKTGNKNGNKTENQTGGNEATTRAYTIEGGANPDSNVVT
ncbi:reverse transcriptase domain-containing protein, partial [Tanacetum coccineum]